MIVPELKSKLSTIRILRREISRTRERLDTVLRLTENINDEHLIGLQQDLSRKLNEYIEDLLLEYHQLTEFINKIDDMEIKEIFMLRYFDAIRSWSKIAYLVGERDESYVRRKHNSYLRKLQKKGDLLW